jgi:hypothetical protein
MLPEQMQRRFLGYLRSVIGYYPDIRLEGAAPALVLEPSPPHVASRTVSPMKR